MVFLKIRKQRLEIKNNIGVDKIDRGVADEDTRDIASGVECKRFIVLGRSNGTGAVTKYTAACC